MFSIEEFNDTDMRNWILQQLPAVFDQTEDSNNQALLNIIADRLLAAIHDLLRIYQDSDLDYAGGTELDTIGADWGVDRIDADDDFMRFLIRLARIRSRIGVTENDIIDLISYTLGADPSEFTVETRLDKVGEVQAIKITNIPNKYHDSLRKTNLLGKYIAKSVADEVRVLEIQYSTYTDLKVYVGAATQKQIKRHSNMLVSQKHELSHRIYLGAAINKRKTKFSNATIINEEENNG